MKVPNWFRIVWWAVLLLLIGGILYGRRADLLTGRAVPADVLIFLVWVGLFLVPLFQEVNLFGLKLKQEVAGLKQDLANLRAEFRNTVDVRAQINPTFNISSPPPDKELPALEERIRSVLNQVLTERGVQPSEVANTDVDVSDDVAYLFKIRYQIERELRRIWDRRMEANVFRKPRSIGEMASILEAEGFIESRVVNILRQVYSVASPAIHGEPVSEAKMAFVRDVAPRLIATLRALP
jgi:hypothetical protein